MKLFDLRMPDAITPITTLSIMPSLVRFLPSALELLKASPLTNQSSSLVSISSDGYFQTSCMDYDGNFVEDSGPIMTSICALQLGQLTSAAVSSSGRVIAFGSSSGAVVQMCLQHIITEEEEACSINMTTGIPTLYAGNLLDPIMTLHAEPLDSPAVPIPPVPKSVHINDPTLGTSYVLCKHPETLTAPLLSSFATTLRQAKTRLRIPMARRYCSMDFYWINSTWNKYINGRYSYLIFIYLLTYLLFFACYIIKEYLMRLWRPQFFRSS